MRNTTVKANIVRGLVTVLVTVAGSIGAASSTSANSVSKEAGPRIVCHTHADMGAHQVEHFLDVLITSNVRNSYAQSNYLIRFKDNTTYTWPENGKAVTIGSNRLWLPAGRGINDLHSAMGSQAGWPCSAVVF